MKQKCLAKNIRKKYKDLKFDNLSGSEILKKLQKTPHHSKILPGNEKRNEITPESLCHLDPDLDTGIYGAIGNASSQLKNFKQGDLLLFLDGFLIRMVRREIFIICLVGSKQIT